jgi:hypothetical protein
MGCFMYEKNNTAFPLELQMNDEPKTLSYSQKDLRNKPLSPIPRYRNNLQIRKVRVHS